MIPLNCKTHYSLLKGLSTSSQIASRCQELNFKACTMVDSNSLSGSVSYAATLSKAGIKPIIGCDFSIQLNGQKTNQIILARTNEGFSNLLELLSRAHDDKNYIDEPIISINDIQECGKGLLIYTGPNLPIDLNMRKSIVDMYKGCVDEVFIQISNNLQKDELRRLADLTDCKRVAVEEAYYARQEDAAYHRLMLCTGMKATLKDVEKDVAQNLLVENHRFFTKDDFYIKDLSTLGTFTQDEIEHTDYIESICETIQFGGKPALPQFVCPNGLSEADYLRQLCQDGWKNRGIDKLEKDSLYSDRLEYELGVLQSYDVLNSYFLIVQDYVRWAKNQDWLVGNARGSAGGSLVSYLSRITEVNPVKYKLLFERFYNAGRNTPEKVSLPDIDIDFPTDKRDKVVEYISQKYGADCVSGMVTFGKLQGRSAIREVLRVNEACGTNEMNEISKRLPQTFEIADEMEEQKEDSVIKFTLHNMPKLMAEYVTINEEGELEGDYAEYFSQAMRLEGINRTQGRHASGIVIANKPIRSIAPMIRDKVGGRIVGFDMKDSEQAGLVKFDILGLNLLNKLQGVKNLLKYGRMNV